MRKNELVFALNAGGVDPEALARVDLEKMRLAGEHPVANLLPRVLGPATLRPGLESLHRRPSDVQTRQIKFLRSLSTSYMLMFSADMIEISDRGTIVQVPAVSATVLTTNWTNASSGTATASGGSTLTFLATSTNAARLRQAVGIHPSDLSTDHILRIVVDTGPVVFRAGTNVGGEEYVTDTVLDTGTHKIAINPAGAPAIYLELRSDHDVQRTVSQIQFESTLIGGTGPLRLPTPYSWDDIQELRTWQSIDVLFVGDGGHQQRRIEHRGARSWSIALERSETGPWNSLSTAKVTITPSSIRGNATLTASDPVFRSGHVGSLIELTQTGKTVTGTLTALNQATDHITITGTGAARYFTRSSAGSAFVGTMVIERSLEPDNPATWATYLSYVDGAATFSAASVDDGLNNLVAHYRCRISAYTSGSVSPTLTYEGGTQTGVARITNYSNSLSVGAEVLSAFGNTSGTKLFRLGDWSDVRGWPRVPVIHDDRLYWFRNDQAFGSVVDDYSNYDDSIEGDSAPLTRSVGAGSREGVLWALSEQRLVVGTAIAEHVLQASELDEPITPTAFTVRKPSRRGSADIEAVAHDDGIFFAGRSGRKLYELSYRNGQNGIASVEASRLNPAAYRSGIVRMAVQQQPDTRLYAVMSDGSVTVLTYERDDKVVAVTTITTTGGLIEDVSVIPRTAQDEVYFIVNRNGARYQERLGLEADQIDVSTCTLLDAYKVLTGTLTQITGADHVAGQTVQVWADGRRIDDVAIDLSGVGNLGGVYSRVVYGKRYTATFKSVKLSHAAGLGTAIGQTKIVHGAALVLANSCLDGIRIGRDASNTEPFPDYVDGAQRTENQFFAQYDADVFPINSTWDADARVYFQIDSAEGPATVQAIVLDVETRDGAATGNG